MKRNNIKFALVLLSLLAVTACDDNGNVAISKVNDNNWEIVGIGQDKAVALHLLGKPDYTEQLTLPLGIETERLTWKSYFPNRKLYQLDLALNRVVAKHTSVQ
jgi:hypothetical protein